MHRHVEAGQALLHDPPLAMMPATRVTCFRAGAPCLLVGTLHSRALPRPSPHPLPWPAFPPPCSIAMGLGEGVAFPAIHSIISRSVPGESQSTAVGIVTAASYAGTALAFGLSPAIIDNWGWPVSCCRQGEGQACRGGAPAGGHVGRVAGRQESRVRASFSRGKPVGQAK